jgi:signal transduction histidine kinase
VVNRAIPLLKVCGLAVAYLVAAKLGLAFATIAGTVTLVWPASGLAIGALHLCGPRYWPGIWLGAFVANATIPGVPLATAAFIASGNTVGALTGSTLLRRAGFQRQLARVADVVRLTVLGAMIATLPSALMGSTSLVFSGRVAGLTFGEAFRVWWLGDLMGVLIFFPLFFTAPAWPRWPTFPRACEGAALAAALLLVTLGSFDIVPIVRVGQFPKAYMAFPILIWAGLRFGPRGAALGNASFSFLLIWATTHNRGPFVRVTLNESLLSAQAFAGVAALTPLVLAASVAERDRAIGALEEFISIASHELKTPLTPLTLNVQRLKRLLAKSTEYSDALASSERQIVRLTRLVADLLDLTRTRSGMLVLDCEEVDLAVAVREVAEGLREQMDLAGCELRLVIEEPIVGVFDRARIQQLVSNLLTNAMKFGAKKPVSLTMSVVAAKVKLTVRDEGIGVDDDERALIFERFARAKAARRVAGLGLGLYIVRQIVQAHRGTVRLASTPGAGSTFTVELPLKSIAHGSQSQVS